MRNFLARLRTKSSAKNEFSLYVSKYNLVVENILNDQTRSKEQGQELSIKFNPMPLAVRMAQSARLYEPITRENRWT